MVNMGASINTPKEVTIKDNAPVFLDCTTTVHVVINTQCFPLLLRPRWVLLVIGKPVEAGGA